MDNEREKKGERDAKDEHRFSLQRESMDLLNGHGFQLTLVSQVPRGEVPAPLKKLSNTSSQNRHLFERFLICWKYSLV
jgi:hypothetical protein